VTRPDHSFDTERTWRVLGDGDRYVLEIPDALVTFELDRPRRERGELIGELTIRTTMRGARTDSRRPRLHKRQLRLAPPGRRVLNARARR
jgi:hypothetical protein